MVCSGQASRRRIADELRAAASMTVPDVIAPDLHVLLRGINPSLHPAARGHHFAWPNIRFRCPLHVARYRARGRVATAAEFWPQAGTARMLR